VLGSALSIVEITFATSFARTEKCCEKNIATMKPGMSDGRGTIQSNRVMASQHPEKTKLLRWNCLAIPKGGRTPSVFRFQHEDPWLQGHRLSMEPATRYLPALTLAYV